MEVSTDHSYFTVSCFDCSNFHFLFETELIIIVVRLKQCFIFILLEPKYVVHFTIVLY